MKIEDQILQLMTLIMITLMVGLRAAQTQDIMAFRWEQNTQMVK